MPVNGPLTAAQRQAILRDYRRKNPNGEYRHTIQWVAEKHGVTPDLVNVLRVAAGTARNGNGLRPLTWACPACSFRALHQRGHGRCLGDTTLMEWEADQALIVILAEEEVAA